MRRSVSNSLNNGIIYSIHLTESDVLCLSGNLFSRVIRFYLRSCLSVVSALLLCLFFKDLLKCYSFLRMSPLVIPPGSDLYFLWSTRAIITFCLAIQHSLVDSGAKQIRIRISVLLLTRKQNVCAVSFSESQFWTVLPISTVFVFTPPAIW